MPRLPTDAFERFLALPASERSYAALARHLGVSKRSVVARASRESWQARLARIEEQGRRRTDERAAEDLAAIDERHLKTARAVLARGLEALKSLPLGNAAAAVRAIEMAVRMERLVLGADRRPEGRGASWSEVVDGVQRAAELATRTTERAPSPTPEVVPTALRPRFFGES